MTAAIGSQQQWGINDISDRLVAAAKD